MHKHTT